MVRSKVAFWPMQTEKESSFKAFKKEVGKGEMLCYREAGEGPFYFLGQIRFKGPVCWV